MPCITVIAGARPNFMKVDPVLRACAAKGIDTRFVHTGQHYDDRMSRVFFRDLGLREPDVNLGTGSGSHAEQTASIMVAYEKYFLKERPDWTVVVGDVNSTLACALAAAKLHGKVCHVEAGLRSRDWSMPEEINRVVTDRISDLLLTPSPDAGENLVAEGVPEEKIRLVGNVMIDTLLRLLPSAQNLAVPSGLAGRQYGVVTLHRPSNVDNEPALRNVVEILEEISLMVPVVFPVHPRTEKNLAGYNLLERLSGNAGVILTDPAGYLEFLGLMHRASFVLTDSGGLQEETSALRIPCLTMRENTERPVTVERGTNELVGSAKEKVLECVRLILRGGWKKGTLNELWDGRAAERCVDAIIEADARC